MVEITVYTHQYMTSIYSNPGDSRLSSVDTHSSERYEHGYRYADTVDEVRLVLNISFKIQHRKIKDRKNS